MTVRIGFAALALLAACPAQSTLRDPHENDLSITVHNEAGSALCEVYIFLADHTDPGHNWLQAQREIPTGESRGFWVPKRDPAETYQIQTAGCPTGKSKTVASGYAPSIFMNASATVVLFDEGNPASKEAAQTIVHANENTTLIPAKFIRRSSR